MTPTRGQGWSSRHPDAADITVSGAFVIVVAAGTLAQRGTGTDAVLAAVSLGLGVGVAILWSLRRRRDRADREAHALLEQRLSIARELHDVVAHHVSVIGIQAAAARRSIGRSPEDTVAALSAIEASSRAAVLEMQRLVTTLRGADETRNGDAAGDVGPVLSPSPTLADLPGLCDRMEAAGLRVGRAGLDDARFGTLPGSTQVALYRVAQEALTNALRHGGAGEVTVSVRDEGGWLVLSIAQGPGTSPRPAPSPGGGLGIPGMRERVGAVGGTLEAGPTADGGFAIEARVPSDRVETGR